MGITLHLTYLDKFISEIIIFVIPLVVMGIALLDGAVDLSDILQAASAFLIAYFWHRMIFKKE